MEFTICVLSVEGPQSPAPLTEEDFVRNDALIYTATQLCKVSGATAHIASEAERSLIPACIETPTPLPGKTVSDKAWVAYPYVYRNIPVTFTEDHTAASIRLRVAFVMQIPSSRITSSASALSYGSASNTSPPLSSATGTAEPALSDSSKMDPMTPSTTVTTTATSPMAISSTAHLQPWSSIIGALDIDLADYTSTACPRRGHRFVIQPAGLRVTLFILASALRELHSPVLPPFAQTDTTHPHEPLDQSGYDTQTAQDDRVNEPAAVGASGVVADAIRAAASWATMDDAALSALHRDVGDLRARVRDRRAAYSAALSAADALRADAATLSAEVAKRRASAAATLDAAVACARDAGVAHDGAALAREAARDAAIRARARATTGPAGDAGATGAAAECKSAYGRPFGRGGGRGGWGANKQWGGRRKAGGGAAHGTKENAGEAELRCLLRTRSNGGTSTDSDGTHEGSEDEAVELEGEAGSSCDSDSSGVLTAVGRFFRGTSVGGGSEASSHASRERARGRAAKGAPVRGRGAGATQGDGRRPHHHRRHGAQGGQRGKDTVTPAAETGAATHSILPQSAHVRLEDALAELSPDIASRMRALGLTWRPTTVLPAFDALRAAASAAGDNAREGGEGEEGFRRSFIGDGVGDGIRGRGAAADRGDADVGPRGDAQGLSWDNSSGVASRSQPPISAAVAEHVARGRTRERSLSRAQASIARPDAPQGALRRPLDVWLLMREERVRAGGRAASSSSSGASGAGVGGRKGRTGRRGADIGSMTLGEVAMVMARARAAAEAQGRMDQMGVSFTSRVLSLFA